MNDHIVCSECGEEIDKSELASTMICTACFKQIKSSTNIEPEVAYIQPHGMTRWKAASIFVSCYMVAMFMACPSPSGIIFFWMFPLGLFAVIGQGGMNNKILIAIGYLPYVLMFALMLIFHKKKIYFKVLLFILLGLLLLNVNGCWGMLRGLNRIT